MNPMTKGINSQAPPGLRERADLCAELGGATCAEAAPGTGDRRRGGRHE